MWVDIYHENESPRYQHWAPMEPTTIFVPVPAQGDESPCYQHLAPLEPKNHGRDFLVAIGYASSKKAIMPIVISEALHGVWVGLHLSMLDDGSRHVG